MKLVTHRSNDGICCLKIISSKGFSVYGALKGMVQGLKYTVSAEGMATGSRCKGVGEGHSERIVNIYAAGPWLRTYRQIQQSL